MCLLGGQIYISFLVSVGFTEENKTILNLTTNWAFFFLFFFLLIIHLINIDCSKSWTGIFIKSETLLPFPFQYFLAYIR